MEKKLVEFIEVGFDDEIDFDDLEYIKQDNTVVDITTGEIIEDKQAISKALDKQEKQEQYDKAKKKELKKIIGKVDKSETHKFNWKADSHFIKHYRTEKREYMKQVQLSPNGGLILFYLENYIEQETNRIAKSNGDKITNKDIEELTGLGSRTIFYTLDELEDKHFIKRVGNSRAREMYYNPHFMCSGNVVSRETIKLFKDYTPITPY